MKLKELLDKLITLTINKNHIEILNFLNNIENIQEKGKVFELYLKELYEGSGWIVVISGGKNDNGADLLLIHPDNPENVIEIIQAKNHKSPLSYDDTRNELRKFEEESSKMYDCKHFKIVSINGFVKKAEEYKKIIELKEFNLYLGDWDYVRNLIDNYEFHTTKRIKKPKVKLFAHNQIAYEQINAEWETDNKIAVVQATGTGKTYIISAVLSDFLNKKVLILAPSNYILEQIKDKALWTINDNVEFMTYQKLITFTNEELHFMKYDLIILDEFHRVGAEKWGESVNLLIDLNKDTKVLGTSATPIRFSDGRDMVDEIFDKQIEQEISLPKAIVRNILPSPTYVTSLYTLKEEVDVLKNKIKNSNLDDIEKEEYYKQLSKIEYDMTKFCIKI